MCLVVVCVGFVVCCDVVWFGFVLFYVVCVGGFVCDTVCELCFALGDV